MKKIILINLFALLAAMVTGQSYSDTTLQQKASEIRNETRAGANTAIRLGDALKSIIYSKINKADSNSFITPYKQRKDSLNNVAFVKAADLVLRNKDVSDSLWFVNKILTDSLALIDAIANAGNSSGSVLSQSLNVQIGGSSLGGLSTGDNFVQGTSIEAVLRGLLVKAIHPTYYNPTLSLTNSTQYFEYGYNVGTFVFGFNYAANDAGTVTGTGYYQNGSAVGTTVVVGSLTSTQGFNVVRAFAQGNCKNDNLGNSDCYGRITTGSVSSNTVYLVPFHKRYIGWANSSTPTDAEIIAAITQDNSGGSGNYSASLPQLTTAKYLFYANTSICSSVTFNGFPSTADYDLNSVKSFTNPNGAAFNYYITVSKAPTGNSSSTQVNFN